MLVVGADDLICHVEIETLLINGLLLCWPASSPQMQPHWCRCCILDYWVCMDGIHAAAMFNRMGGLECKYARHYVNRDVA